MQFPQEGLKFTLHSELCHLIETFLYHADVGWFNNVKRKIYFQESLSGPFTNAKTQELPGALPPAPPPGLCPWTPPGALERAPGPHAVRRSARFARSAFMDSKLLALTRRTNTKLVPTGLTVCPHLGPCLEVQCIYKLPHTLTHTQTQTHTQPPTPPHTNKWRSQGDINMFREKENV